MVSCGPASWCIRARPGDRGQAALDWAVLRGDTLRRHRAAGHRRVRCRAGVGGRHSRCAAMRTRPLSPGGDACCGRGGAGSGGTRAALCSARTSPHGWRGRCRRKREPSTGCATDSATVLRKIRSADGHPGVTDALFGHACRLHDAHAASAETLARAPQGEPAHRHEAPRPCCAARRGGVWISHVRLGRRRRAAPQTPPARGLRGRSGELPLEVALMAPVGAADWDELHYADIRRPNQLRRLALRLPQRRDVRAPVRTACATRWAPPGQCQVLVLEGGADFFEQRHHLHDIGAGAQTGRRQRRRRLVAQHQRHRRRGAGDAGLTDRHTVALLRGNAGAGGFPGLRGGLRVVACRRGAQPALQEHGQPVRLRNTGPPLPRRVGGRMRRRWPNRDQGRLPMDGRPQCAALRAGRRGVGRRRRQPARTPPCQRRRCWPPTASLPTALPPRPRDRADRGPPSRWPSPREELARMRQLLRLRAQLPCGAPPFRTAARAWTPRHLAPASIDAASPMRRQELPLVAGGGRRRGASQTPCGARWKTSSWDSPPPAPTAAPSTLASVMRSRSSCATSACRAPAASRFLKRVRERGRTRCASSRLGLHRQRRHHRRHQQTPASPVRAQAWPRPPGRRRCKAPPSRGAAAPAKPARPGAPRQSREPRHSDNLRQPPGLWTSTAVRAPGSPLDRLCELAEKIAGDLAVLVLGESGHRQGGRGPRHPLRAAERAGPFVVRTAPPSRHAAGVRALRAQARRLHRRGGRRIGLFQAPMAAPSSSTRSATSPAFQVKLLRGCCRGGCAPRELEPAPCRWAYA